MSIFTGAGVAIVTPMKANGEVNYPKLEELLNYQIENGTDAIIICGTTGESSTLTHEEHLEAIRFTIEKVAGRIPSSQVLVQLYSNRNLSVPGSGKIRRRWSAVGISLL